MHEGREGDVYLDRSLLAGIFNRLGDGKGTPVRIELPAALIPKRVQSTREQLSLARDAFREFAARQRKG